jgi:hypothetical protein
VVRALLPLVGFVCVAMLAAKTVRKNLINFHHSNNNSCQINRKMGLQRDTTTGRNQNVLLLDGS